jgi:uncharacterized membrane protein
MKNSVLLLFFFILYDIIITVVFVISYYKVKVEYNKLDKYNEELFFEVEKLRRKCYSKDKEE